MKIFSAELPHFVLQIFMLKARLAATESMTHDVIRDLLGVKMNMKNCAVSFQLYSTSFI